MIPHYRDFTKSKALSIFNEHLTNLLLGGLFVNEVSPEDVTRGSMNIWGYHRHICPVGQYAKLSQALRTRRADIDDAVRLFEPQIIFKDQYISHHYKGFAVSQNLPTNFSSVFLPSCTAFCNEEWDRALILGWSSIELIISQLWDQNLISGAQVEGIKAKRRKNFLSDTRTWSSSTRIELLWQKGKITDNLYSLLDTARAARNNFIHSATACTPHDARATMESTLLLVQSIASNSNLEFDSVSLMHELDEHTSIFQSPRTDESGRLLKAPTLWRYLDPAPGFSDWGDRPFDKIPELQLQKIQQDAEGK